MNFKKLQKMQRALDDAILKEKPEMTAEERFKKTCVALSVEIAELANTAEHFKFWKENKGKIDSKRFRKVEYQDTGVFYEDLGVNAQKAIAKPIIKPEEAYKLTLVEEASDCLHFILSLANQLDLEIENFDFKTIVDSKEQNLILINRDMYYLYKEFKGTKINHENFRYMLMGIYSYFKSLGITQEELEQAYYDKNEINYQRLEQGY